MLKRIFKFIITAGLTQNQYESIRASLSRKNYRTLRAFAIIATFFFTLAFLVAMITGIDSMTTKSFAYGTSSIFSAITLGLTLWLGKKHYKFLSVLQFAFITQLLLFGLYISLIVSPDQLTISLLAFFMITPHIFISKPRNTLLPIITSIILFLFFAPQVKPTEILPLEIVDCLTYGTIGLVTGFYSTRSKLRGLLFEKQIIELNNNEHLTSYLKSISNIYVSMTYLDLESRAFIQLKSHKFVSDYIKKVSEDFDRHIVIAMKETTQAEYLEDILKFVDPNTLAERIKGKSTITHEFLGKNYGWCRARFIAVGSITEDYVPRYVIFAVEDINEQKSREKTLIIKAETDAMTGILNRQAGIDKIQQSLKEKKKGMFCLFDVDKFKKINDSFGHQIGDQVIKAVADSMKKAFREDDILLRLGGDEFVAYVFGVTTEELGTQTISRFFDTLNKVKIESLTDYNISISLGATFYRGEDNIDIETLYHRADTLAYQSKEIEGKSFTFWR